MFSLWAAKVACFNSFIDVSNEELFDRKKELKKEQDHFYMRDIKKDTF